MSTKETFRPTQVDNKVQPKRERFVPNGSFLDWRNEQLKKLHNLHTTVNTFRPSAEEYATANPKQVEKSPLNNVAPVFRPSEQKNLNIQQQETTRRNILRVFGGLAASGLLVGLGLNAIPKQVEATQDLFTPEPTKLPSPTEIPASATQVIENTPTPKVEVQGLSDAKPEIKLNNGIQYALPVQWDNSAYYTTLSQLFGENRQPGFYNPATGHSGIDIVAGPTPDDTNSGFTNGYALAAVDGIARLKQDPTGFGNNIEITRSFGGKSYIFRVAHLSAFAIKDGDVVKKGQQLGRIGTTGASTGNHLHFDIREADTNKYVDPFSPETFLSGMMDDKHRAVRIEQEMKRFDSPMLRAGIGTFIAELGRKYNIDPALVLSIMAADTSMYKNPSLPGNNNPGNVANTDSCPTCGTFPTIQAGIEGIFTTLDNNLLGGKKMVGELSNGGYTALGRPVQTPVYASSAENWNNNVTKMLAHFYGLDPKLGLPDDWIHKTLAKYNFRIYS